MPESYVGAFFAELFHFGFYRRTQGRIVRQVTLAAIVAIVGLACWKFSIELEETTWQSVRTGLPLALFLLGCWVGFRIIQLPKFADFLISVEAEMAKVAWPKRTELINASIVVIIVIFLIAALLFGFDAFLQSIPRAFNWLVNFAAGASGDAPE